MRINRLLLVEDEELGILPAQAFFDPDYWDGEEPPPELLVARTGTEFEEVFVKHAHHLDAVVIDVVLGPGENGVDVYRRLHSLAPHVPCLVITGHAPDRVAIDALKAGICDYVRKPFAWGDLWRQIQDKVAIARLARSNGTFRQTMIRVAEHLKDREQLERGVLREETLRHILEVAVLATSARGGWLFLVEHDSLKAVVSVGYPTPREISNGLFQTVLHGGIEQCFTLNAATTTDGLADFELDKGSLIAVPLSRGKTTLGVMEVARTSDATPFSASEVSLLNQLAELASIIIHSRQRELKTSAILVQALGRALQDGGELTSTLKLVGENIPDQTNQVIELVAELRNLGEEHLDFWADTARRYLEMTKKVGS